MSSHARDLHIIEPWFNVARALRAEALKCSGHAVLRIAVLVDGDGKPVHWTHPKATRIEPRANGGSLQELIEALGE